MMSELGNRLGRLGSAAVVLMAVCMGCSADDAEKISDQWMQGTINGKSWVAGPGAVTEKPGGAAVVRLFDSAAQGDACSFEPTMGLRVEIGLATMHTGRYDVASNAGYYVETWEGLEGERDPYGAIEIINAPKTKGGKLLGKARFGSAGTEDYVEGSFEAVVCDDFP